MKMISRRQSNARRRILPVLVTGIVLIGLLSSPLRIAGGALELISWPLRALGGLAPDSFTSYFEGRRALQNERDLLALRLTEREREFETLRASLEDYEELRALRGSAPENALMSAVVLTPHQSPYDSLVIDSGTADGVATGAIVYAFEGRPIGVVLRAEPSYSVVGLFSSPGVETHVYVRGANVHAKATGLGGGTVAVLVPHGVEVSVGDAVLYPSIAPAVIGTVEWINDDPSAPGTVVTVSQIDALTSLRFVAVSRESQPVPTLESITATLREAEGILSPLFLPLGELASTTLQFSSSTAPQPSGGTTTTPE